MDNKNGYKTRQKGLILDCILAMNGRHFTAEELCDSLRDAGSPVGKTTVYRALDRLVEDGEVRKYYLDEKTSACYQYAGGTVCQHFHLKCTSCGRLIHAECSFLEKLASHIGEEHGFEVDSSKTVFYGKCAECIRNGKKTEEIL